MLYPQPNPSRNLLDLSGFWDFQPDPEEVGEAQGFMSALPNPRPVAVPGSWNEQYADLFNYFGAGWYLRRFTVPAAWKGERVFLRFGSVNYRAVVWVNGRRVGEHEGGHLPFAFEITDRVRFGAENVIAVMVENHLRPDRVPSGGMGGAGAFSGYPDTAFDFFPYTGIHRPVLLYTVPRDFIRDITVIARREARDVQVEVRVEVDGEPAKGRAVLTGNGQRSEAEVRFRDGVGTVVLHVPSARLWSPADPFLYDLTISAGKDVYTLPVGLRTVEVRGKEFLLNGEPVYFRGFGRHEDFCASGRGLNLPLLVKDYDRMRWVGANSFRTSHYPYSEEDMMLADRLGFLVIDEIPAANLVLEDDATLARLQAVCLQMIEELIARDKNRAAVVMWSVANEPTLPNLIDRLTGKDTSPVPESATAFLRDLVRHVRALDPTRPVTLTGMMGAPLEWQEFTDVICVNRYWGWYEQGGRLEEAFATLEQELDLLYERFGKPILLTEFGADAVAGLHGGVMWSEDYQAELIRGYLEVARRKDFVIGTHVWCFADFQTTQSVRRVGGMNLKGIFTRDRQPKRAAYVLRDEWTGPAAPAETTPRAVRAPEAAVCVFPPPAPTPAPEDDLRALLADVARRLDGTRPGLTTTLRFDFGPDGGVYRFVIVDGRVTLEEGEGEAVAWVKMKAATALKIFCGKLNPMAAVVTGQIRVGGDLKALSVLRDMA